MSAYLPWQESLVSSALGPRGWRRGPVGWRSQRPAPTEEQKEKKIDIIICAALPNTQQFQCSDRATRSTSVLVLYHDWLFVSSHLPARGSHWGIDWVCLNIDPSHQEESERYVQSAKHTVSAHGCHSQTFNSGNRFKEGCIEHILHHLQMSLST